MKLTTEIIQNESKTFISLTDHYLLFTNVCEFVVRVKVLRDCACACVCVCGAGVFKWNDLAGGIGGRQLLRLLLLLLRQEDLIAHNVDDILHSLLLLLLLLLCCCIAAATSTASSSATAALPCLMLDADAHEMRLTSTLRCTEC